MESAKLNLDLLTKLLKENKGAIRQALLLFVETTLEDMRVLGARISERNFSDAAKVSHSLKSRFVYLGNEEATNSVKLLEGLLKDGREQYLNEINSLFRKLDALMLYCIKEVNNEIKSLEN